MYSLGQLDYLNLEISRSAWMRITMCDKSTQSDATVINDLCQQQICPTDSSCQNHIDEDKSLSNKVAPQRPPPPKVMKSPDALDTKDSKSQSKSGGIVLKKLKTDVKIRKKLNTFAVKTTNATKAVYKRMATAPFKSFSVPKSPEKSRSAVNNKPVIVINKQTDNEKEVEETILATEMQSVELRPHSDEILGRSRSLNLSKSTPPKIVRAMSTIMSLEDLIDDEESIFSIFAIMSMFTTFLKNNEEIGDIHDDVDFVEQCLKTFIRTSRRQVKDMISHINDSLSHVVDLDSIGLVSSQQDRVTINCIPGWKQIRIMEDHISNQKYIVLKNSYYKCWTLLSNIKIRNNKRWICFPIECVNTLDNEINMADEGTFYWKLLKFLALMSVHRLYENDKSPENIDPHNILIVSSRCGIIVIFHECLEETKLWSLDFLHCDSISDVPEMLNSSKVAIFNDICNYFKRTEIISVLISSTWPLDFLALMLVELLVDVKDDEYILTSNDE